MRLIQFLIKAKIACYASQGEATERILDDGAKELSYSEDEFIYRDRYYGFKSFIGEEVVWENEAIVWSMNYYGNVISDIVDAKEIYSFLQKAMSFVGEDRPFRGPSSKECGDFEYIDESTGDVNNFSGKERIFFKGREVYNLVYHGGVVK